MQRSSAPALIALACAPIALACALAPGAAAETVLAFGDSITVGADDEPVPDDRCPPGGPQTYIGGWRSILECRLAPFGVGFRAWARGGTSSWWARATVDQAIASAPGATTALVSFHVNDCGEKCGPICAGGARAGEACTEDADCPLATCNRSFAHACSAAETRANVAFAVARLLDAGYERVIFWKSPGRINRIEGGNACALRQFDGSPDSLDALFLDDPRPAGFADDPRVSFVEETYSDFCPGSGLQGCGPDDGEGDRRRWWFTHDPVSTTVAAHIHPNAWGYMELAARLGEALVGAPLDARPPRPSVALQGSIDTALRVRVSAGPDPDGDPLSLYVWASCADTSGRSADPACLGPGSGATPPHPERECGAVAGADHDGPVAGSFQRHLVRAEQGRASLEGLAPDTLYRICAVAWDGFRGSYPNESLLVRTRVSDADGDDVPDDVDNCLDAANPDQRDADADGYGDLCDADYDGSGAVTILDYLRLMMGFGKERGDPGFDAALDTDGDGTVGERDFLLFLAQWGRAPGPSGLLCAGEVPCAP